MSFLKIIKDSWDKTPQMTINFKDHNTISLFTDNSSIEELKDSNIVLLKYNDITSNKPTELYFLSSHISSVQTTPEKDN
ncbi:MAG: hypothetical protein ACRC1M_06675 [Methanobacteriaceae archaeon]